MNCKGQSATEKKIDPIHKLFLFYIYIKFIVLKGLTLCYISRLLSEEEGKQAWKSTNQIWTYYKGHICKSSHGGNGYEAFLQQAAAYDGQTVFDHFVVILFHIISWLNLPYKYTFLVYKI